MNRISSQVKNGARTRAGVARKEPETREGHERGKEVVEEGGERGKRLSA